MTKRLRLIPRSLFGRMLAIAALSTGLALVFAGIAIGNVLERFVMRGLDERLDAQVAVLARAVRPDATLDRTRAVDLPDFGVPGSDWSWHVDGPAGRVDSGTTPPLPPPDLPHRRGPSPVPIAPRPRPARAAPRTASFTPATRAQAAASGSIRGRWTCPRRAVR